MLDMVRREAVVEIMRDAAGELADGLHFLRLPELPLQPFLRRDIPEQAQHQIAARLHKGIANLKNHPAAVMQDRLPLPLLLQRTRLKMPAMAAEHLLPVRVD